jgi:hypothetical protein
MTSPVEKPNPTDISPKAPVVRPVIWDDTLATLAWVVGL